MLCRACSASLSVHALCIKGAAPCSRESDVYAFGITLWEVMTRNIPYAELELTFQEILGDHSTSMVFQSQLESSHNSGIGPRARRG